MLLPGRYPLNAQRIVRPDRIAESAESEHRLGGSGANIFDGQSKVLEKD
jgi:hypothetical protein